MHYIAQAEFEIIVNLLPPPVECWDYSCVVPPYEFAKQKYIAMDQGNWNLTDTGVAQCAETQ